ncbi:TetR/AcrR family transcriptional regulator [Psychrobacillus soli]|uniref:TetR/AcrR family transcriptional regulator n=1 Tax=Psychrobacillus soli TaxID=1543965 RepID=A0A544SYP6_9BACI|nr:TetR/AcrR family transcriptional regulator [Psychrobacillus soli]TQR10335.1 TetR/AcrR family transcriptional regulator [Psychrobacillus soli]
MSEDEVLLQQLFEDDKLTEKQKKIILAAIESFSEKGYAATSTSEIAKKAGVAEGTIFRHYKTKKELLVSIVAPLMAKLIGPFIVNDFHKVLDHPYEHVEDFLRAAIQNRSDIIKKMLPVIKIMMQEIPFQPELREQFLEQVARKTFDRILLVIKEYQDKGQLIEMPTLSAARLAISSIFGYLISRYIFFPDSEWDDELEIERTVQFIMHGLSQR